MGQKAIVDFLIKRGEELFVQPYQKIRFTGNNQADTLLNNLEEYPHAYVLACIMDRQIKAERAWLIPYEISQEVGGFELYKLLSCDLDKFREIFVRRSLHRFNDTMAQYFHLAIHRIHKSYDDNASNIWKDSPRSATIVRRFLRFDGVGIKIATMAANILARDFKIPLADKICIDISPDVQVMRVFTRLGLINQNAGGDELIYCARELNPDYPGIFDLSAWDIGRKWCRPTNPKCG
ncbi:unnamed protein product, partial [marine sediment metagenome]